MRILEALRDLIDADPKWMDTRGLTNLANSLSKLQQSESRDAVFSALAYAAMMRFEDIERGQHFSNLLHGFASAGVAEQYEDLYLLFGDMIAKRLEQGMEFQVDGPFHYTTCPLSGEVRENGNTKWNTRILRALGHNVVRVKYQDWYDAADAGKGKSFLRKLMEL